MVDRNGQEHAEEDNFDLLLYRRREAVSASADFYEVAVLLETSGIGDSVARRSYGASDVFDLSARLRRAARAPTRLPSPGRPDWYPSSSVSLLRGFIFTMSGLVTMTAVGIGGGSGAARVVLGVNVGWMALMQAVAFLGYLAIERAGGAAGPRALAPLLRCLGGAVVVAVVVVVLGDARTGILVGASLVNLLCMVLLLVLQRVELVARIVLPVALVAILQMLLPSWGSGPELALAAWVLGAVALLVVTLRLLEPSRRRSGALPWNLNDIRLGSRHALAGFAVGAVGVAHLVAMGDAGGLRGGSGRDWLLAALPFFVPVTIAEALVVDVRRRLRGSTAQLSVRTEFVRAGHVACARVLGIHLAAGAVAWALAVGLGTRGSPEGRALVSAAFFLVASLLVAGLLLVAGDAHEQVALVLGGTAVVLLALQLLTSGWRSPGHAFAEIVVLLPAVVVAVVIAVRTTTDIETYR